MTIGRRAIPIPIPIPTSATPTPISATPAKTMDQFTTTNNNAASSSVKSPSLTSNTNTNPLTARKSEDFSKEELMSILQKMKTQVKVFSIDRATNIEQVKSVESDRSCLFNFVKSEMFTEAELTKAAQRAAEQNKAMTEEDVQSDAKEGWG